MHKGAILLFIAFLCLTATASAEESVNYTDVKEFELDAPTGKSITTLRISDIEPPANQQFTFDAYNKTYKMNVSAKKHYSAWWEFDINMTYPNGTTQSKHLEKFAPYNFDYDLQIQYDYDVLKSIDTAFDMDIYLGLMPLRASFTTLTSNQSETLNQTIPDEYQYYILAFSHVKGTSDKVMDASIEFVTGEEYKAMKEDSLKQRILQAYNGIFTWSWDLVLYGMGKIPFIGDYLEPALKSAGMLIGELLWWFDFLIIRNWYIFLLLIETFILGDAMVNTKSLFGLVKKIGNNHIKLIEFGIMIIQTIADVFMKFLLAIGNLIQSLKPT